MGLNNEYNPVSCGRVKVRKTTPEEANSEEKVRLICHSFIVPDKLLLKEEDDQRNDTESIK